MDKQTTGVTVEPGMREPEAGGSLSQRTTGGKQKPSPRMFHAAGSLGPTRALSPRQLPTDHDYAVPTREYQSFAFREK
jgi:hypothetical protein